MEIDKMFAHFRPKRSFLSSRSTQNSSGTILIKFGKMIIAKFHKFSLNFDKMFDKLEKRDFDARSSLSLIRKTTATRTEHSKPLLEIMKKSNEIIEFRQ